MLPTTPRPADQVRTDLTRLSMDRLAARKRGNTARVQVFTRRIDELLAELAASRANEARHDEPGPAA